MERYVPERESYATCGEIMSGGSPIWYLSQTINSNGLHPLAGSDRFAPKTLDDWDLVRFDKMQMASESVRFGCCLLPCSVAAVILSSVLRFSIICPTTID